MKKKGKKVAVVATAVVVAVSGCRAQSPPAPERPVVRLTPDDPGAGSSR